MISKLRKNIEKKAMATADADQFPNVVAEQEVHVLAKIIRKRGETKTKGLKELSLPDFIEDVPIGARKKTKGRGPLKLKDKIEIAHKVLVQFLPYSDVAKEYRIGQSVICKLIKKAKDNPAFLEELQAMEERTKLQKQGTVDKIQEMIQNNVLLDTVDFGDYESELHLHQGVQAGICQRHHA